MTAPDLTRRARRWLTDALPHNPRGLVSELADEVDRLRAEAERYRTLWDRHGKNDLLAERDAARAALERVRGLVETAELAAPFGKPPYWTGHILNALEGKP